MIQMAMGGNQMDRFQAVLADIVFKGILLVGIIAATVDDDTLLRVVADHIAVLLQWIAHESLDIHTGT
jgi:DNA-binding transcriptional regulator of glucitol operon